MAHRNKVLTLYRAILKTSKTWESASRIASDTEKESLYIASEARHLFRQNKHVRPVAQEILHFDLMYFSIKICMFVRY